MAHPIEVPEYLGFWAKAQTKHGPPNSHPVAYHSLDVAAVGLTLLLERSTVPPGPWRTAEAWPGIAALLALHDIGKFSRPFQAKSPENWPPFLGPLQAPPGPKHDTAGFLLLDGPLADALNSLLPGWRASQRRPLLRALCGHHGRPPQDDMTIPPGMTCEVSLSAAREFAGAAVGVIASGSLPSPGRTHGPALAWWLAGLAVLADWIGSSETWFPYRRSDQPLGEYWQAVALPKARKAVAAAGVLPTTPSSTLTIGLLVGANVTPSPVQSLAGALDLGAQGPALALIEDQTGSGKTEAALLLAHRLMRAGRANGLFVALPTMATANALYGRLADAYLRLFAEGTRPLLVLAHGRRADHRAFQDSILRVGAVEPASDDPADESGSAQCAAWIAADRRRTFLADVGVGTIDQALLAVLPSRHAQMRLHGLHRRVLLIDEAHAYDAYMREELLRLIEFQAGLGGSTIVLSATLPQATRRRIAAAYAAGSGVALLPPSDDNYPLVTACHQGGIVEIPCAGRPGLERQVVVERLPDIGLALDAIELAYAAGLAVAWIRNAVDDAVEAHAALAERGVQATLFHARFAMGDRQRIENDVVGRYGKASLARNGVVVATQVIEQSLDLDFDLVVTDLAPMDLLLQRAGRLWRHCRPTRPCAVPRLLVLSPEAVDEPDAAWLSGPWRRTAGVYRHPGLLWRTARVLFAAGVINAPEDVRRLVEEAYADLPPPPGLVDRSEAAEGQASAHKSLAWQNLLVWAEPYRRGANKWESDIRTPTRLGEESRVFRLARWEAGVLTPWYSDEEAGRAWALSEISLPLRLATDVPLATGGLEAAVCLAREAWGQWERDLPLVALEPMAGRWLAEVLRGDKLVQIRYSSLCGVAFTTSSAAVRR